MRGLAVHPRSDDVAVAHVAGPRRLHPDFGPAYGAQPVPYGIPVTVVGRRPRQGHRLLRVRRRERPTSATRSAATPGSRAAAPPDGDRHAIVVDRSTCRLYETWATYPQRGSRWTAGSGATWRLTSNRLRPQGWTSADAAGLPILPGLLRYGEVRSGRVDHAIRFTTDVTDQRHVWPARHDAGSVSDPAYPPMGARFRLKAVVPDQRPTAPTPGPCCAR